jgi:ATP-dependent RNA circularization protein (DNA/RNA ligase family)
MRDEKTNFKTLLEGQYSIPAFRYLEKNGWVFTEKIDGTNIRVMWDGNKVTFSGKTDGSQIPAFLIQKLMEIFTAEKLAPVFPSGACLYGEGYGAKIQSGGNYIPDGCGFILFDVLCGKWWLERASVEDIAVKLNIPVVPVIGSGTLLDAVEKTRSGFPSVIGKCTAEGIVMRPSVEMFDRNGDRIIAKIKHKDFKK